MGAVGIKGLGRVIGGGRNTVLSKIGFVSPQSHVPSSSANSWMQHNKSIPVVTHGELGVSIMGIGISNFISCVITS